MRRVNNLSVKTYFFVPVFLILVNYFFVKLTKFSFILFLFFHVRIPCHEDLGGEVMSPRRAGGLILDSRHDAGNMNTTSLHQMNDHILLFIELTIR